MKEFCRCGAFVGASPNDQRRGFVVCPRCAVLPWPRRGERRAETRPPVGGSPPTLAQIALFGGRPRPPITEMR
jgi:hypothetical protein